jgi:chromosome partitioning protein
MSDRAIRAASFLDKGGTGKTTTTAHLGVALAKHGYDVLLVDLAGKQGDLSKHFGQWETVQTRVENGNDWPNISTVFQDQWDAIAQKLGDQALDELILETDEEVDIIPAHPGLDGLDAELAAIDDVRDRYARFDAFLSTFVEPMGYDVILLDLPGLSNNVSYNGLWAAKNVIAPAEMGPFEAEQVGQLTDDLAKIRDHFDVDVRLGMVVPNKVDTRTKLANDYLDRFAEMYPDAIAPSSVPESQDIRNATEQGQTVFALEEPSKTAQTARDAYHEIAESLLTRIVEP